MADFLPYVYAVMWFIISIALFYVGRKNHFGPTTVILSGMFMFMGVWWLIDALLPDIDMLNGTYGWVFRIIITVFVLVTVIFYLQYRKGQK